LLDGIQAPIRVVAILGPTGVGKTEICIRLAGELGAEILSCDSRQVYRFMDIGTAKPLPQQRALVKHWLIDILDPCESYSVHRFALDAADILRKAAKRGAAVIICGGTGLYFRGLSEGLSVPVGADPLLRQKWDAVAKEHGPAALHSELAVVDPVTAGRLHPNDVSRIIRALSVYHSTGRPLSSFNGTRHAPAGMVFLAVRLTLPRPQLYERINRRVDKMAETGLYLEFRTLRERGYGPEAPGMQCVGYREMSGVEEGRISLDEAILKVKQNTRRYAKRQMTWFSHQVNGPVVDVSDPERAYAEVLDHVRRFLDGR
jgi:tRNA dimethylallyltransferase